MCGITGIFAFNEIGRFHLVNLKKASESLNHRGPDDGGLFTDHFVGLGHRRLSVIDLSAAARQPMVDPEGRFHLIFNGEIYNFQSLRQQLPYEFKSDSDTEVLLAAYRFWGKDCLQHLNGFFAFAIYDRLEQELFLARDPLGKKPLLYYYDEDKFIFGSEMKALLAFGIDRTLDYTSLFTYFQFNYSMAPESIFEKVKKIPPGHGLTVKKRSLELASYWCLPKEHLERPGEIPKSYEEQKKKLWQLTEKAVQNRLIADVPLGAFLSGGIDSSIVASLAARHSSQINTFSIGYRDEAFFDETHYARAVAKKAQTDHHVFYLSNDDLYGHLQAVLDSLDEPFADSSALPLYILSKESKKTATVALTGDGADELFSGYHKHAAAWLCRHPDLRLKLAMSLRWLWPHLPQSRSGKISNRVRQLVKITEAYQLPEKDRYWRLASLFSEIEVKSSFLPEVQAMIDEEKLVLRKQKNTEQIQASHGINGWLYHDMDMVLPNDMLVKTDLMSMAHGLELRCPFLDHDLVAYGMALPESSKINGQLRKRILQDTFRDLLPSQLYRRPKKGFEVPLLGWMRKELDHKIRNEWLSDDFIREQKIFDPEFVQGLLKKLHSSNPGDSHARVWALIVFQNWWKKYLHG